MREFWTKEEGLLGFRSEEGDIQVVEEEQNTYGKKSFGGDSETVGHRGIYLRGSCLKASI